MIDRSAAGVDHAAKHLRPNAQRPPRTAQAHSVAVPHARHFTEWINDRLLAAKADDLGLNGFGR